MNVHGDGAIAYIIKTLGETGKLDFDVPNDEDEINIAELTA